MDYKIDDKYKRLPNGHCYLIDTPDEVIQAIENAKSGNFKLRFFYGDTKTGADWKEFHDVFGEIGFTNGKFSVPILLKTKQSYSGTAISTTNIVKITLDHSTIYIHPNYNLTYTADEENLYNKYEKDFLSGRTNRITKMII